MSDRDQLRRAESRFLGRMPHDEPENPDCPECGTTTEGDGNKWEWYFECPKCGFVVSGDNY